MSHTADWRHSLGPGHFRREVAGWSLAALTVAATAAAAANAVLRTDSFGQSDALQNAVYLDLATDLAPPAIAAPEAAPEPPMTEVPPAAAAAQAPDPEPALPRPVDPRPLTDLATLPDLALPSPDAPAIQPLPPPPEAVAEAQPDIRPKKRPAPERKPKAEPMPEVTRTVTPATVPAPQQQAVGRAAAVSKGELDALKARWGAEIRKRIQRRARAAHGLSGEVVVRLTVAPGGSLGAASVARSSGNERLDQLALRAVTSAGRFPRAPRALSEPSYTFTLPISFSR